MDFCFPNSQLDIEIDGYYHTQLPQMDKDLIRDIRLKENGWTIIRIPNQCVVDTFSQMLENKNYILD
jgi:very-short-patch-repair endonuclease